MSMYEMRVSELVNELQKQLNSGQISGEDTVMVTEDFEINVDKSKYNISALNKNGYYSRIGSLEGYRRK